MLRHPFLMLRHLHQVRPEKTVISRSIQLETTSKRWNPAKTLLIDSFSGLVPPTFGFTLFSLLQDLFHITFTSLSFRLHILHLHIASTLLLRVKTKGRTLSTAKPLDNHRSFYEE